MGTICIECTEVAINSFITGFADICELHFITMETNDIHDVVVLVLVYKFCHNPTIPYDTVTGFLKILSEPDFKKRPPTPHRKLRWSGEWNQTYVVTVI